MRIPTNRDWFAIRKILVDKKKSTLVGVKVLNIVILIAFYQKIVR